MKAFIILLFWCTAIGCTTHKSGTIDESFTIIVLPDTQNAIDFRRQKAEGFAIDSSEIFIRQMQYIAGKGLSNGGDVAFLASVGDVWQHVTSDMDPGHAKRGIEALRDVTMGFEQFINPDGTFEFEIPKAVEGYKLVSDAEIPFGVAPGNHDYDAWWVVDGPPTGARDSTSGSDAGDPSTNYQVHVGGLSNFRMAFGSDTDFFRGKEWYVSGYEGGGSSAQIFSGGGYKFLHLAFEMHAGDSVIAWAQGIINEYAGLPTIISTHDYLNRRGERLAAGRMNLALVDPEQNNSAEKLWQDFISKTDQVFMVLSGHQAGQALRIDKNDFGHEVYQILADFQSRQQSSLDAGQPPAPGRAAPYTGDGWLREMTFHLNTENPRIEVRTYSSHYDKFSSELKTYAKWYKDNEQPEMTDEEFLAAEDFELELSDFHRRFGVPTEN